VTTLILSNPGKSRDHLQKKIGGKRWDLTLHGREREGEGVLKMFPSDKGGKSRFNLHKRKRSSPLEEVKKIHLHLELSYPLSENEGSLRISSFSLGRGGKVILSRGGRETANSPSS